MYSQDKSEKITYISGQDKKRQVNAFRVRKNETRTIHDMAG